VQEKENQREDIRKITHQGGKLSERAYDSLRFFTCKLCNEERNTSELLTPQMEKQVNLTLIGIAADAVERNPREITETMPPNRAIDLFIALA